MGKATTPAAPAPEQVQPITFDDPPEPANPAIDDNTPALFERVEKLITDRGYERDAEGNWPEGVVFERHRLHKEAPVTVKLSFPNGDRIGAQGDTTEEAVTLLEQRLAEWPK